jgi:glutamate synthase (NADPH/NADH) small chain
MGKTTGFLEFGRELPSKLPVDQRLGNYNEFVSSYPAETLNQQASRCMDCGVPFCHHGCPLGNIIPEFNEAVYRRDWKEAYEILSATNNFPEFTGRICPAPCESACVLGINQPAVTIEEIEKHIIEIAFENNLVKAMRPNIRSGKKVAVIGSGPAGLAAAAQLNQAGHCVTVYERDDEAGGLLRYGIPDFKLEKWVIDRRLKLLEEEGVLFKLNANVGLNVKVNDLLREYNAIVLAGGSTIPRDLNIEGRNSSGVVFAMDYLKQSNLRVAGKNTTGATQIASNISAIEIMAEGKDVVVIGGGDTGSDCVGTANRQRARSVTQLELLPKPPASRNEQMPWPLYPMLLKSTSSHEEGCAREWAVSTKKFLLNSDHTLRALVISDIEWKTVNGKPQFVEVAGTERELPCQLVLLAMGFMHPQHDGLLNSLDVEIDARGNVKATESNYETSIPKVFAAGDMRRGQSLVVWAISEGRECARKVDEYLTSSTSILESKDRSMLANSLFR